MKKCRFNNMVMNEYCITEKLRHQIQRNVDENETAQQSLKDTIKVVRRNSDKPIQNQDD